ncbi:hypothetical protein K9K77_02095 [Candidatus Babeliales bacterium]|nr:hypothetical protein [Candidatus Babeliales bacterium]
MEVVMRINRLILFFAFFILDSSVLARVKSIASQKGFDTLVSATNPLSVIFFYRKPRKNIDPDTKQAIRYARKGFKDVSNLEAYNTAGVKFGQVNLDTMPELQEMFDLEQDENGKLILNSEQGHIVLFKRTRAIHVSRPFVLHKNGSERLIYNSTKNLMDSYMGDDIDELIQDQLEHQQELEKIRAENTLQMVTPYFLYDPFDTYYNGYYEPWRRRYHHRGFGMHFSF